MPLITAVEIYCIGFSSGSLLYTTTANQLQSQAQTSIAVAQNDLPDVEVPRPDVHNMTRILYRSFLKTLASALPGLLGCRSQK